MERIDAFKEGLDNLIDEALYMKIMCEVGGKDAYAFWFTIWSLLNFIKEMVEDN